MINVATRSGLDIALRGYGAEHDRPFVCSSWAKSAHQGEPARRIPLRLWSEHQRAHMNRCLARGACVVAAHPTAPAEIIGWACAEARGGALVVHWIYVVHVMRKQGVARELIAQLAVELLGAFHDSLPIVATQWPAHAWIGAKLRDLAFDPYLVAEAS